MKGGYFGATNKFQKSTQAIKQAFKHTLKQTKHRQWNLMRSDLSNPSKLFLLLQLNPTRHTNTYGGFSLQGFFRKHF